MTKKIIPNVPGTLLLFLKRNRLPIGPVTNVVPLPCQAGPAVSTVAHIEFNSITFPKQNTFQSFTIESALYMYFLSMN